LWSDDENEAKKQYANICASNRALLVKNILPDCHEYELMDNFNQYGLVESVKIIRDPETKDALRAYALFSQAKDTEVALNAMHQNVEGGCVVSRLI
jgi:RNA recognition motif-containing protein